MTGTNLQGTNIISMIVPTNHADTYATHDSFYGKGGWREVNTLAERDAIPQERRRQGMVVFVKETFKAYILKNSIYNGGWVPFPATEDVSDIINEAISEGKIEIDLTAYATKAEVYEKFEKYYESAKVDSLLEEFDSKIKEWVEDKNYLTEHQSLENYVTKTSLGETLLSYVLKTELEQELENYVKTEDLESALEPYAKTEYVEETYATKDEVNTKLEDYSTTAEIDEKYATKDEVIEATDEISATVTDLGGRLDAIEADYITEAKLTEKGYINSENAKELISSYGYVDNEALEEKLLPYATTDAVNTALSSYATKESLEQAINNSGYLTVKDLQGYATELWVEHYIIREGLLKVSDLKGYATELWVKDYCTNYNFVTKEELQGYATEKWVEELVESITGQEIDLTSYQKKEDVTLQTESKNVVGAINELKDKIENVDLSDYAKKDELDLKADKDELALKADKEELNSRVEKELEGTHPGDVAKIQNQTDGGVMQYVSADKSNSAITVNDGSQNVGAEICSLDPDGKGSRIIANKTGAYYAVGNTIDVAPEKEIAVKGDLADKVDKAELEKYIPINNNKDGNKSYMANEKDGGIIKYIKPDESYAKVTLCNVNEEAVAQIVATNKDKTTFAKIDARKDGICYSKKTGNPNLEEDEIVVKKDLKVYTPAEMEGLNPGDTAVCHNAKDGGSIKYMTETHTAFVGVDNAGDELFAEFALAENKQGKEFKKGNRLLAKKDGIFYTKDANSTTTTPEDEIITKKDITNFITEDDIANKADKSELEVKANKVDLDKYIPISVNNDNGTFAYMANEKDGGIMKVIREDGTFSKVTLNDGTADDAQTMLQLYIGNKEGTKRAKINGTLEGLFYTKESTVTPNDELVVKKDIADFITSDDIVNKADKSELEDKATKEDLKSYIPINVKEGDDTAYMANEKDGGLIKLTTSDKGYAKVSICKIDEQAAAQIVATDETKETFAKIDARKEGICYTKKTGNPNIEEDELVVKKDIANFITEEALDNLATKDDLTDKADKTALDAKISIHNDQNDNKSYIANEADGAIMKFIRSDKQYSKVGLWNTEREAGLQLVIAKDEGGNGNDKDIIKIEGTPKGMFYAKHGGDCLEEEEIATKGDLKYQEIKTDNGTAILFNEKDGGGVKFVRNDGVESFVGVNDGIEIPGLAAQIYADKQNGSGKWEGAKIDVTNEGIYYTVGDKSFTDRAIKDNEIAVRSDLKDFVTKSTVQEIVDETISSSGEIELSSYQKKQDELLDTEDKTIVGAINEINAKNKEIEELKKQIETLTTQISTLQTQVSEMTNVIKGPQYLILGEDEQ